MAFPHTPSSLFKISVAWRDRSMLGIAANFFDIQPRRRRPPKFTTRPTHSPRLKRNGSRRDQDEAEVHGGQEVRTNPRLADASFLHCFSPPRQFPFARIPPLSALVIPTVYSQPLISATSSCFSFSLSLPLHSTTNPSTAEPHKSQTNKPSPPDPKHSAPKPATV
jgi:hypothetical protein